MFAYFVCCPYLVLTETVVAILQVYVGILGILPDHYLFSIYQFAQFRWAPGFQKLESPIDGRWPC